MEKLNDPFRNIIVIGASAGGIPAVNNLLSGFTSEMDVAVIVVIHVSRNQTVST
ncbi:chemotaxis protein CheB [Salinimicrobium xinjiangense]|uniref:chemotaxis protein CheB n=1 Tax=Salinimicrobium xinjiangense TaxID=438596 RepID=UPI00041AC9CB|nr:chemotaxis protein CheB [Salinimicrobium xinjiangense]